MQLEYNPLILPFVVSMAITAWMALYALRRRGAAAKTFALLMLTLTVWTFCYVMGLSSVTLEGKSFWLKMKYLGSGPGPVVWFIFSLQTTNNERWLNKTLRIALFAWVIIIWLVVFTNDFHHWMWTEISVAPGFGEERTVHGFFFSAYAASVYLLIPASVILYINYYCQTPPFFRRQGLLLMMGGFVPVAGRMIEDILRLDFVPEIDEVIFFFLFSGILFALAIFRYGALNIVHIAHSLVIQNISAGIIVLDVSGRVVELNPYAQELIGAPTAQAIGKTTKQALAGWPDLATGSEADKEISVRRGDEQAYFFVQSSEIKESNGARAGYVIVLFDITARKNAELQLEALARTDPLTGVTNRRYFFELAEIEFARSCRYQHPMAIMMLDVDHFKRINDSYGHAAGDQVLKFVAAECRQNLRPTDIFARYGGEEFICLLSESSAGGALIVAERMRRMIEESRLEIDQQTIRITISLGLAHRQSEDNTTLDRLINQADQALYKSKAGGRNRVTVWE